MPLSLRSPLLASPRALAATLATVLLLLAPGGLTAQLAVVVNPANPVDDLSSDALKRLYLGQATTFPSGARARLATHAGSADRFDHDALRLQPEVVRSRWMAITFRGEAAAMPTDFVSAEEVKRFVKENPSAIAFLPLADVDGSVKVLRVDGRRPTDAGYLLR